MRGPRDRTYLGYLVRENSRLQLQHRSCVLLNFRHAPIATKFRSTVLPATPPPSTSLHLLVKKTPKSGANAPVKASSTPCVGITGVPSAAALRSRNGLPYHIGAGTEAHLRQTY